MKASPEVDYQTHRCARRPWLDGQSLGQYFRNECAYMVGSFRTMIAELRGRLDLTGRV
jgi:hypothetical protein